MCPCPSLWPHFFPLSTYTTHGSYHCFLWSAIPSLGSQVFLSALSWLLVMQHLHFLAVARLATPIKFLTYPSPSYKTQHLIFLLPISSFLEKCNPQHKVYPLKVWSSSWAWWYIPRNLKFRKQRWKNRTFQPNLGYVMKRHWHTKVLHLWL